MQLFRIIRILMPALLLGYSLKSYGQDYSITKSDFYYNYSSTSVHKVFAHDDEYYYVIKYELNQFNLERLDKDLNLIVEEDVKLNEGLRTYEFETIVHFDNKIYLFTSRKTISENILYYQEINKQTLVPTSDFKELIQVGVVKGNWADFSFALSRKETKFMIASQTKLHWTKAQHNEYYVYSKGFELLWSKRDVYEFKGAGPRDNKFLVDEMGNVTVLSLQRMESIFTLFSSRKNTYTIYRYTQLGENFMEYPVGFENIYIRGIKLVAGNQGEMLCAGLYSELYKSGVRGTFFFKIDEFNSRIQDLRFDEFSDQLLAELADKNEAIIAGSELVAYLLTDLVIRPNGKFIMIAEQLYNQTFNTYNNVLVTCFDSDGSVYWNKVIRKRQDFDINSLTGIDVAPEYYRDYIINTGSIDLYVENYCSYSLIAPIDKNEIVLFYNDHIKNLEPREKLKNFGHPKKSYIAAVRIDEYGNINKQNIMQWKKKDLYPEPLRYYDDLHNTVIIPAYKGRKYNYYKITADL